MMPLISRVKIRVCETTLFALPDRDFLFERLAVPVIPS